MVKKFIRTAVALWVLALIALVSAGAYELFVVDYEATVEFWHGFLTIVGALVIGYALLLPGKVLCQGDLS